jgi:hypothetical protein
MLFVNPITQVQVLVGPKLKFPPGMVEPPGPNAGLWLWIIGPNPDEMELPGNLHRYASHLMRLQNTYTAWTCVRLVLQRRARTVYNLFKEFVTTGLAETFI